MYCLHFKIDSITTSDKILKSLKISEHFSNFSLKISNDSFDFISSSVISLSI